MFGEVAELQLSADGQYLVSGGSDGHVKLWRINLEALMEESCDWLQFYIHASPAEETKGLCPDSLAERAVAEKTVDEDSRAFLSAAVDVLLRRVRESLSLSKELFNLDKEDSQFNID